MLDALDAANRAYEQKFGYIFIICGTGRTAEEILKSLRQRLQNASSDEIGVAAGEQAKITASIVATGMIRFSPAGTCPRGYRILFT